MVVQPIQMVLILLFIVQLLLAVVQVVQNRTLEVMAVQVAAVAAILLRPVDLMLVVQLLKVILVEHQDLEVTVEKVKKHTVVTTLLVLEAEVLVV
jgi:hypothetical protein